MDKEQVKQLRTAISAIVVCAVKEEEERSGDQVSGTLRLFTTQRKQYFKDKEPIRRSMQRIRELTNLPKYRSHHLKISRKMRQRRKISQNRHIGKREVLDLRQTNGTLPPFHKPIHLAHQNQKMFPLPAVG